MRRMIRSVYGHHNFSLNNENKNLIITGTCIFVIGLSLVYIPAYLDCPEGMQLDLSCSFPEREDLREVVYASTDCSIFWRVELFSMWKNQTYDYKK